MVVSVETTLQHPRRGFIKLEDTVIVQPERLRGLRRPHPRLEPRGPRCLTGQGAPNRGYDCPFRVAARARAIAWANCSSSSRRSLCR